MTKIELFQGDSLKLMKKMEANSFDFAFTSPPYNRKRNDKYELYDDTIDDYFSFLKEFTDELLRITKGYTIINIQKNYYNKADVFKYIGYYSEKIQEIIIWEKLNPMPASGCNITNAYEFFIVMGDKSLKANHSYTKNHISTSVNSKMPKIHKAVMKQEVSDWFIEEFTQPEDKVIDCFMGLGTTGISCKKFGRSFTGIELNEPYYEIAKNSLLNQKEETCLNNNCNN